MKKVLLILLILSFGYGIYSFVAVDEIPSQGDTNQWLPMPTFSKEDYAKLNELPIKTGLSEHTFPNNAVYKGNRVTTISAINLNADSYAIVTPEAIIRDTPTGQLITPPGINVNTSLEQMQQLLYTITTMYEPFLNGNGRLTSLHYDKVIDGDTARAVQESYEDGLTNNLCISQLGLNSIISDSNWGQINTLIDGNSKYFILDASDRSHSSGYIFENQIDEVYILASKISISTDNMDTNQNTFIDIEYHINNLYFYEKYLGALRTCGIDMYPIDTMGEIQINAGNKSVLIFQSGGLNGRIVQFTIRINQPLN